MQLQVKSKLGLVVLAVTLVFFLFSGCSKSPTSPQTTQLTADQLAVQNLVQTDPAFDVTAAMDESDSVSEGGLAKSAAVLDTVFHWWRQITDRDRHIDIMITDSTARVTVTDTLMGLLHVVGADSVGRVQFTTPLTDVATHKALFKRRHPPDGDEHRGWVLAAVSDVLFKSSPLDTRQIRTTQVRTSMSGVNRTLTESGITALTPRDSILTFTIGDTVWVTVTTGDPSDSVFLHVRDGHRDMRPHRKSLHNNGDGTFSGQFLVPQDLEGASGRKHMVVDVIKHDVLDNHARYDSHGWGILYRVRNI